MLANPTKTRFDFKSLAELVGKTVKAKAFGWDEELTEEELLDYEPYDGPVDISGPLELRKIPKTPYTDAFTVVLVGGVPADPNTVKPVG